MTEIISETNGTVPQAAAPFGNVPNDSESFRTVPQPSASFGNVPNSSESFRTLPKSSARSENHTLTVREAARLFEAAGVARTERSIVNWCQLNKMGIARLDSYFDPNERRYFITPQSVESAIQEEEAKTNKEPPTPINNSTEALPNTAETSERPKSQRTEADTDTVKELEKEVMDLMITNRGKDFFIEQLKSEREAFAAERQGYVEKLMSFNRQVGELETQLRQLNAPRSLDGTEPSTK